MGEARLLNAATAQTRHYGVLLFRYFREGLSTYRVALGYKNFPDDKIRASLAAVVPGFMDFWMLRHGATTPRTVFDTMVARGWFNEQQVAARIEPRATTRSDLFTDIDLEPETSADIASQFGPSPVPSTRESQQRLHQLHTSLRLGDDEYAVALRQLEDLTQKHLKGELSDEEYTAAVKVLLAY
jgi:hypothetical protein